MGLQIVILASGYGQITKDFPKVCERIGGVPMIARVVETVFRLTDKIIVTINPLFEAEIRQALSDFSLDYAVQLNRNGSADAVGRTLEKISEDSILVIFADMPFWSFKTLERLVRAHINGKAVVSLVTIELDERTPKLIERYGRILRDETGRIIAIVEPGEVDDRLALQEKTVNPSLYCFDISWLRKNLDNVPLRDKSDGYPPERSLPHLVVLAAGQNQRIIEIPLENHLEALGINTKEELEFARQMIHFI